MLRLQPMILRTDDATYTDADSVLPAAMLELDVHVMKNARCGTSLRQLRTPDIVMTGVTPVPNSELSIVNNAGVTTAIDVSLLMHAIMTISLGAGRSGNRN